MKEELIRHAQEVLAKAYAPYSNYSVGAAIWAGDKLYVGVNVENASYGLTICAERSAATAAVSDGQREFKAIAIAVAEGSPSPCGACRQFLREFSATLPVYLVDDQGQVKETNLGDLLPNSFGPEFLEAGSEGNHDL